MGSAAGRGRARQGRIIQRHDAIRDLLANTLNALEEVTVVSTEPTLDGEGGHGQRGDIKLLANGTEFVIDVTVACPATRHMTRTHHTGTVPGAAGGYAQACKRRKYGTSLQPFVIETWAGCIVILCSSCTTSSPMRLWVWKPERRIE